MSRLIRWLIFLAIIAGGLQWFMPRWAADAMAQEIQRMDHGPKPTVALTARPFWELFGGRFKALAVEASNAEFKSLVVRRVSLHWTNGVISLSALEKGHVAVLQPGKMRLSILLTGADLSSFLAKQGSIVHPEVMIVPSGVSLRGEISLGGSAVPLNTQGKLTVSPNHEALIFHPSRIDGLNIPVMTKMQLLNLSTMKLPVDLGIDAVTLGVGQIVLTVGN